MLRALIGFLCVCFSIPCHAKLGEAVPQLIKRFGSGYTVQSDEIGKMYRFRSEKLSVDVLVANGSSVAETYFSDHPLTASGEPPNDIVRAVLDANVPGTRWVEIDAKPFTADYALQSSDHKYIATLKYTGPQPEGMIWTITVGGADVVRLLPSVTPSQPIPVTTPLITPAPAVRAIPRAIPVIIASPKPTPRVDFSPQQFTPSQPLKRLALAPVEPPGYLAKIALLVGAGVFYVIALARAFRHKTARWVVAAVLGAVLFLSIFVVILAELPATVLQQPLANQVSNLQGFVKGLYSRLSVPARKVPATQASKENRAFDLPTLASTARPAVVMIVGYNASGKPIESGSGFFVSDEGRLVTNWHVVDGIMWAQARTENGAMYNIRGVLASSPLLDLAVLKADAKGVQFLPVDGSAVPPVPGTHVAVIGSPFALEGSLSEGIVAANRSDDAGTWLQISAPISPGSSGSPVLDDHGRVVGVATLSRVGGQNLNFARSARDLARLLESIPAGAQPTKFVDQLASDPDYVASKAAADKKDFTLALKLLNRVSERFPRSPNVLFQLGFLYGVLDLYEDAARAFRECIKIDPTDANAWLNLAMALSQLGNFQEAINACNEAIKLQPDDAETWKALARYKYQARDFTGASQALQKAESLSQARAKQ
jgi:S1-C subfamily serine protease